MTSRELYDRVGGFRQSKHVFWAEDATYIQDIAKLGYGKAILDGLTVVHHGGPQYSETVPSKQAFFERRRRRDARKELVKRSLLRIPMLGTLNERYRWFEPPLARTASRPAQASHSQPSS
jgi:hypothetical protein